MWGCRGVQVCRIYNPSHDVLLLRQLKQKLHRRLNVHFNESTRRRQLLLHTKQRWGHLSRQRVTHDQLRTQEQPTHRRLLRPTRGKDQKLQLRRHTLQHTRRLRKESRGHSRTKENKKAAQHTGRLFQRRRRHRLTRHKGQVRHFKPLRTWVPTHTRQLRTSQPQRRREKVPRPQATSQHQGQRRQEVRLQQPLHLIRAKSIRKKPQERRQYRPTRRRPSRQHGVSSSRRIRKRMTAPRA